MSRNYHSGKIIGNDRIQVAVRRVAIQAQTNLNWDSRSKPNQIVNDTIAHRYIESGEDGSAAFRPRSRRKIVRDEMNRKELKSWTAAAVALLWILVGAGIASGQSRPKVQEVIDKIDQLYRADSSYALMEMQIVNPNWERTLRLKAWSEGTEKTLIRILEPAKERGTGTLRIGNEMWNYLPKVDKTIRIPPSMMMSSWMGSDFTNDDLVKEFTFAEDYDFQYAEVQNPEAGRLYIECTPKQGRPIVWNRVVLGVDAGSLLPVTEKYYDERDRLMRTMSFRDVKTFGDRTIPSVMELVPEDGKGKTIIRYLEAEFDIDIPADTFTTRSLRTFRE